jgi:hypothetical protein
MKKIKWQYTLVEILIVIIGITIAFSMNKCSESSKDKKLRHQYLTNLMNDVNADKLNLETNIEELNSKLSDAIEILPYLNSDSTNQMKIVNNVFNIVSLSNFNPKDVTYQTLINSGDLKLIDNFNLKTAIEAHYSNYKEMSNAYVRQESIVRDYVGNYLINHADYDKLPKGKFPFTNEKLLKNIVQSMRGSFILKIDATKKGIKSCDSLIATINTALKN